MADTLIGVLIITGGNGNLQPRALTAVFDVNECDA
jgi:hypothetical protein